MEILHIEKNNFGRFYVPGKEADLAYISYYFEDNQHQNHIYVDHTVVSDELKGQGIGKRLILNIVEMAQARKLMITPECPFVAAYFDKHPELQHLLYTSAI